MCSVPSTLFVLGDQPSQVTHGVSLYCHLQSPQFQCLCSPSMSQLDFPNDRKGFAKLAMLHEVTTRWALGAQQVRAELTPEDAALTQGHQETWGSVPSKPRFITHNWSAESLTRCWLVQKSLMSNIPKHSLTTHT